MNPFKIISNIRNGSVTINGNAINSNIIGNGCSISIDGNNIIINGNNITVNDKVININITGSVDEITNCHDVKVTGNVRKISVGSGDVEVDGDVSGDIQTGSGDVDVSGSVGGSIKTGSGDVTVGR